MDANLYSSLDDLNLPLLRIQDVERLTHRSRSSIYRDVKSGQFPPPVKIGKRAVAWRHADIFMWLDSRQPVQGGFYE